ncbi:MAG: hypothetical protein IJP46_10485, partial [Prevotella sp.]|nr:hypothetical protein [Prevotella sp.]
MKNLFNFQAFYLFYCKKEAQGEKSVDSSHTPNQNILAQRNSCLRKMLPLHHGKETFIIRLRDVG